MKKLIIFLFISLVIFGADRTGLLKMPKGALEKIFSFQFIFPASPLGGPQNQDLKRLREENLVLLGKLTDQRNLELENEALRAQLGAPQRVSTKFIPTRVLEANTSFLIIDKGQADGVRLGQNVVYKNILAGKVVSVSQNRSRVELPISSTSKISAKTNRNALGIITGGGGAMTLGKVTLSETLEEKDLVFTTQDGEFLPDLLIGEVSKVFRDERALFQQAQLQNPLDFKKLEMVFLIP